MTTGALWLLVFSLSLFIVAGVACLLMGLLDGVPYDRLSNLFAAVVFAMLWGLPTLIAWASWAMHS